MSTLFHNRTVKAAFVAGALLLASTFVNAQAIVSAQRGAEIAPFGMTTIIGPDWGQANDLGYTVGIDYTRYIRSIVQPSLELRYTSANGLDVNERNYAGGLKLQTTVFHIHPYATFLVGHADITFNHPTASYYGDASLIYSLGGGADFNVTSQLKLRVDFTDQHWNLDPDTLTPTTLGIGFSYRIPFHSGRVQ